MGTLFRSEEMALCQLFLQSESSYPCVAELGELGLVQFRDLNPDVNAFQRKFVNEVRRCEEMERKLRFLEKEIQKDGIPLLDVFENPEAPQPREMVDLEATLEKLENETKEINNNNEALKKNFLELTELKHILRKTQQFFDERDTSEIMNPQQGFPADSEQAAIILREQPLAGAAVSANLGFVAGVIQRERIPMFERMLWRVCRGNVFLRHTEIEDPMEDPTTAEKVYKSVFIIFYQGEQLKSRVRKICEGFRATLYPCPESPAERREMAIGVMTRIEDLTTVLGQTQDHRHRVLVAAAKNLNVWYIKVRKIKAIYHIMNMFNLDVTNKCLIAECWVPVANMEHIQMALRRGTDMSGATVPSILNRMDTLETPPTFHRTNKYTEAFQALIDAYGVASYREVNPAPFAIITFPFLFAVMFGDCGHGLLMTLAAAFMIWKEKWIIAQRSEGEIIGMIFGGRYIIILMGLFSIYAGLMYNDCFGKPINIFGSGWRADRTHHDTSGNKTMETQLYTLDPNSPAWSGDPYPFGLDPIWPLAYNKISYTNSMKMKMSVIFGFFQMMFGVVLGLFNHRFFKRRMNIFCEFIPQVLFLGCMFGYLIILIFAKWIVYNSQNSAGAPQLLNTLINMFLLKTGDPSSNFYKGQQVVQSVLLIIIVICVPWMLCLKPYFQIKEKKARTARAQQLLHGDGAGGEFGANTDPMQPGVDTNGAHGYGGTEIGGTGANTPGSAVHHAPSAEGAHGGHDDEGVGDIIIHQAIHTIEYCLGCISNTASYLRLWALSLAHGQLSEVLWTMVLHQGFNFSSAGVGLGSVITVAVFAAWAVLTVAILIAMEGMSAFLHALRLHWVEFQNKFYLGDGYPFMPFNFKEILEHRMGGTQLNTGATAAAGSPDSVLISSPVNGTK